jgi:hypothetical protein
VPLLIVLLVVCFLKMAILAESHILVAGDSHKCDLTTVAFDLHNAGLDRLE